MKPLAEVRESFRKAKEELAKDATPITEDMIKNLQDSRKRITKPMIPDFCLACDNTDISLIKEIKTVSKEKDDVLYFPRVTVYRCPVCGYDNLGPEYLGEIHSQLK
jgi:hypothetical protein